MYLLGNISSSETSLPISSEASQVNSLNVTSKKLSFNKIIETPRKLVWLIASALRNAPTVCVEIKNQKTTCVTGYSFKHADFLLEDTNELFRNRKSFSICIKSVQSDYLYDTYGFEIRFNKETNKSYVSPMFNAARRGTNDRFEVNQVSSKDGFGRILNAFLSFKDLNNQCEQFKKRTDYQATSSEYFAEWLPIGFNDNVGACLYVCDYETGEYISHFNKENMNQHSFYASIMKCVSSGKKTLVSLFLQPCSITNEMIAYPLVIEGKVIRFAEKGESYHLEGDNVTISEQVGTYLIFKTLHNNFMKMRA